MTSNSADARWLGQLLFVNRGTQFKFEQLPIYKLYRDLPTEQAQLHQDFDRWVTTDGQVYIVKTADNYTRIR